MGISFYDSLFIMASIELMVITSKRLQHMNCRITAFGKSQVNAITLRGTDTNYNKHPTT